MGAALTAEADHLIAKGGLNTHRRQLLCAMCERSSALSCLPELARRLRSLSGTFPVRLELGGRKL